MTSHLDPSPAPPSRLLERIPEAILALAVLLFLSPFVALMFYATPNSDDYAKATLSYSCALQPAVRTIPTMAWVIYSRGSGRWLTSFIQSVAMSKVSLVPAYGWLLLLVMLSNILGLAYFFSKAFSLSRSRALLIAGTFYAIWLSVTPFPLEGVFWVTEAFEYQFTLSTVLILAGLLLQERKTSWTYVGLAVLAVAVPAQHEVAGAFTVAGLFAGWGVARATARDTRPWLFSFILASISLAAIVFSPGLQRKFGYGHDVPLTLAYFSPFLKEAVRYGISWLANPQVLLPMICGILLLPRQARLDGISIPASHLTWFALLGVAGIVLLMIEFAGAEMASGYAAFGPRAIGWFQFVFWLLLGLVLITGVPELARVPLSAISRMGVSAVLLLTLLTSTNFRLARQDLRGPAAQWWASNTARLKQHGGALQFDPLPLKPALFDDTFVSSDSTCWVNQCLAVFLRADTVVTKGQENSWVQRTPGCGEKP